MFFVTEGVIQCLSKNQRNVILTLESGDFFGERSLISLTRREYPMVAKSFSTLSILTKANFDSILAKYPDLQEEIINKSNSNFPFLTFVVKNRIAELIDKEEPVIEASGRRSQLMIGGIPDRLQHHKILISMETPVEDSKGGRKTHDEANKGVSYPSAFNLKKIKLAIGEESDIEGSIETYLSLFVRT